MEKYTTGTGQRLLVHAKGDCRGEHCVIHNPSDHSMRDFPTHWRSDLAMMERICPHGVGHPDPDDLAFRESLGGPLAKHVYSMHGCDGCCRVERKEAA